MYYTIFFLCKHQNSDEIFSKYEIDDRVDENNE